ncbi:phosphopantetheine-binding protein [Azospirillum cavernae]|uniref:Phosphopantetheine-binding protein n=1 Tax=Azospirillum cavernae TaxID=2320860 RepID=A0A418VQ95_9PROT|nr:DUF6005 family protein [Azospirillum cavernae]RJF78434.1 phosphopantetheine-binding protein [Azospirillum cavernae]
MTATMTGPEIVAAIHTVLRDHLDNRHLDHFGPEARLNEDLYLDSVLMMELFLQLELSFGLEAPDELITSRDLATVADVAGLFVGPRPTDAAADLPPGSAPSGSVPPGSVHAEEYQDLKIHCVVSCLCDALKRAGIDHRPFYFGVWDAGFDVGADHVLRYHSSGVSHDFFCDWYRRLYGAEVRQWYDHARSKEDNLAHLTDLVERRPDSLSIMAMIDLFHLPERENKFNQNPFPHYLMLESASDPAVYRVRDPDFRWEGDIARDRIANAFLQPSVAGGYLFDRRDLRPARPTDVAAYFDACFLPDVNPLTAAVRGILAAHVEGADGLSTAGLSHALRELPVFAIRKYAYEHGFAFFWRALRLPDDRFLAHCDAIEALFQGFKTLHYAALRLAQTGDLGLAPDLFDRLDQLDRMETALKDALAAVFRQWRAAAVPAPAFSEVA